MLQPRSEARCKVTQSVDAEVPVIVPQSITNFRESVNLFEVEPGIQMYFICRGQLQYTCRGSMLHLLLHGRLLWDLRVVLVAHFPKALQGFCILSALFLALSAGLPLCL